MDGAETLPLGDTAFEGPEAFVKVIEISLKGAQLRLHVRKASEQARGRGFVRLGTWRPGEPHAGEHSIQKTEVPDRTLDGGSDSQRMLARGSNGGADNRRLGTMNDDEKKSVFGEGAGSRSGPGARSATTGSPWHTRVVAALRIEFLAHRRDRCRLCGRLPENGVLWVVRELVAPGEVKENLICEQCREPEFPF
jgi:hypothetical protein